MLIKRNLYEEKSKMDDRQGPTVQPREICSVLCGSLDGKGVWERTDTRICVAESLCCASETVTTLSIGYTPMQIKKEGKNMEFQNVLRV